MKKIKLVILLSLLSTLSYSQIATVGSPNFDVQGPLYLRQNLHTLNKGSNGWVVWGTRDTSTPQSTINFSNINNALFQGNVGIGTNSPDAKLHVENPAIPQTSTAKTDANFIIQGTSGSNASGRMYLQARYYNGTAWGWRNNLVLSSSGKVGIGTTNPIAKLDVRSDGPATYGVRLVNTSGNRLISFYESSNGSGALAGYNSTNSNTLWLNGEGNSFLNGGNVGIGTTDPKNKLSVNGTIWAKKVKVSLIDAADWVFEDDYDLRTLDEVEKYVKNNKHLPEIPSAEEFRQNGLNVAEMDNKLLQKIEELTLYLIEQNKQNQAQQKQLETQSALIDQLKIEVSALKNE